MSQPDRGSISHRYGRPHRSREHVSADQLPCWLAPSLRARTRMWCSTTPVLFAETLLEKSPYAGQVQLFPASATRKTVRTLFTRRRTHIQGFGSADCEPMVQLKDKKNKPAGEMLNIPLCDLQTIRTFIERQVQDLGQSKLPENLEAAVVGRHFLDQLTRIMGVSSSKQGQPIGMHGLNTEATKALICAKLDPLAGPNGLPKDLFEGWQLVYVKVRHLN